VIGIIILAMWTAALTGWGNVLYYYRCGSHGIKPNYEYTVYSLAAAVIAMALGSLSYAFVRVIY